MASIPNANLLLTHCLGLNLLILILQNMFPIIPLVPHMTTTTEHHKYTIKYKLLLDQRLLIKITLKHNKNTQTIDQKYYLFLLNNIIENRQKMGVDPNTKIFISIESTRSNTYIYDILSKLQDQLKIKFPLLYFIIYDNIPGMLPGIAIYSQNNHTLSSTNLHLLTILTNQNQ
jgi:hypothetical protein